MSKSSAKLDGIALAANQGVSWSLIPGVSPYQTTVSVHKSDWNAIKDKLGKPMTLTIATSDGKQERIQDVYPLMQVASDSKNRVHFVISDKRWKWVYPLICKDYNVQRKTGAKNNLGNLPRENEEIVDQYDYLPHTINTETNKRWTAKEVIEDVLELLEPKRGDQDDPDYQWEVESWPINDESQGGGQLTVANLMLRDNGDAALGRALSMVPGADVYIRNDGKVVVYDATDINKMNEYFQRLPTAQFGGEVVPFVSKVGIRPATVNVYYQRELEMMFQFEDDWGDTRALPDRNTPFLENVIPTVDRETNIPIWDPETNTSSVQQVPAGTWVRIDDWLNEMNNIRPENSPYEWTYDVFKRCWIDDRLPAAWGATADIEQDADIGARVEAFKAHYRQTFRINPRYAKRFRKWMPYRAATLDPVTGARLPAAIWAQTWRVPEEKKFLALRGPEDAVPTSGLFINYDYVKDYDDTTLIEQPPMPARINIVDEDLGIFRIEFSDDSYGLTKSWSLGTLEADQEADRAGQSTRNLEFQEEKAVGFGLKVDGFAKGLILSRKMKMRVLLSATPAGPNSIKQFHKRSLTAADVSPVWKTELRISGGTGPDQGVFIAPDEVTARYQLTDASAAEGILPQLMGLDGDGDGYDPANPGAAGNYDNELPGWLLVNDAESRHMNAHSMAVAAGVFSIFADTLIGSIMTTMPERSSGGSGRVSLVGNMSQVAIRIAGYPSGKVDVVHSFPGQQRLLNRLALLPPAARRVIFGELPYR